MIDQHHVYECACTSDGLIIGGGTFLRPLTSGDASEGPWFSWFNDPEVTRFTRHGETENTREDQIRFFNQIDGDDSRWVMAICDAESGRHIGVVSLQDIDRRVRLAEFAIMVGESEFWGRGIGAEATRLAIRHGFRCLDLNRIELGVSGDHPAAVRAYENAGFVIEGRRRQALLVDGKLADGISMAILRSEYEDTMSDQDDTEL
jgi:RimJ/RimL family protein N-acetyltransferase